MNILIVDPKCPEPYDNNSNKTHGLGGTESTIIKIANQLANTHTVVITQHNRVVSYSPRESLHFTAPFQEHTYIKSPDVIIFVQMIEGIIGQLTFKYPKAQKILWLHNYVGEEIGISMRDIAIFNVEIVCVSELHKNHTLAKIKNTFIRRLYFTYIRRIKVHYVYNPIDAAMVPDGTQVDNNKLVFLSSPHKGIENVIRLFSVAKMSPGLENLTLYIANPGYRSDYDSSSLQAGSIVNLGSLPQHLAITHVRSALCVFYPQSKRPETFGLVYAEANAVGTPVLAHDFGSAREILGNQEQILDCNDDSKVIETLKSWCLNGKRPHVEANPKFYLKNVVNSWEQLFEV